MVFGYSSLNRVRHSQQLHQVSTSEEMHPHLRDINPLTLVSQLLERGPGICTRQSGPRACTHNPCTKGPLSAITGGS